MRVIAKTSFTSSQHGNVTAGDEIEVPHNLAVQWIAAGMVDPAKKPEGTAKPLPLSPAGQASRAGKSNTYETKPEPLAPTPVSERSKKAKSVTRRTANGGTDTTKKRKTAKGGRAASKQPKNTG